MLFKLHREGDEACSTWRACAERMGWDFSGYTTKDDPRVNSFPIRIYRQELFHHPPLYPWLLKWGLAWGDNPLLEVPGVRTPEANRGELSPDRPRTGRGVRGSCWRSGRRSPGRITRPG